MSRPDVGRWVSGPVTVEVPATSANLGPGFDCLGLALGLHDTLTGEVVGSGLVVDVEGEGSDTLPRDERHLVVRSMRAAFEAAGAAPPGLRLQCTNAIPQARGLGSSSAAIVGGLALARALLVDGPALDDATLLDLATAIEGHPDNVAPALLGGFVVCGGEPDGGAWAVRPPLDPAISTVVFVPPDGVSTEAARGLLPATVSHADAAANSGRTGLLVTAMGGATGELLRASQDFLHQEYRSPAMPESWALMRALRADGYAAVVSGAGPTVLVLTVDAADELDDRCPPGWASYRLEVDHAGVRTVAP